ncbi:MAG: 30S ribosomal protein S4 [Candidatus Dadabacteria bacterium]|nr:MAG: 30S ribosomal protein S4 [Candidatus Dadabacteria bacterium]
MARYRGSVCRLCRVEGEKLFLKGDRCYSPKCSIERREGAPGEHGKRRGKFSEYKIQLREKQKVKRMYGMLEKQFREYFKRAARSKGVTGTELLVNLERRLDNVVYRMGFGLSRRHARQIVRHGMILVNGRKVNIPSYQVSAGDVVEVRAKSKGNLAIKSAMELAQSRSIPEWVSLDREGVKGTVNALPAREQISYPVNEQLIVELYSK